MEDLNAILKNAHCSIEHYNLALTLHLHLSMLKKYVILSQERGYYFTWLTKGRCFPIQWKFTLTKRMFLNSMWHTLHLIKWKYWLMVICLRIWLLKSPPLFSLMISFQKMHQAKSSICSCQTLILRNSILISERNLMKLIQKIKNFKRKYTQSTAHNESQ